VIARSNPELLAHCLDDLESGRVTLAECLAAHPAVAEDLRELLGIAGTIATLRSAPLDPRFRAMGRQALIGAIGGSRPLNPAPPIRRLWNLVPLGWGAPGQLLAKGFGMVALVIALVLALIAVAGGAVYAAEGTLPGDPLYPVKMTVEDLQLAIATSDDAKARTYLALVLTRLSEIQEATQSGRSDAAAIAATALARDVVKANQHLTQAAAAGLDVRGLANRQAATLSRVRTALAIVQMAAPPSAQAALTEATAAAATGLVVAGTYAPPVLASAGSAVTPLQPTPDARADVWPTSSPDSRPSNLPAVQPATATVLPGTEVAIRKLISETQSLRTDPLAAGQSFDGLLAQLDAAQAALARGQREDAARILDAYLGELHALLRSGHISVDNYNVLYAGYSDIVYSLGRTPGAQWAPVRATPTVGESRASPEVTVSVGSSGNVPDQATPLPTPAAQVSPMPQPGRIPTVVLAQPTRSIEATAKPPGTPVAPAVSTPGAPTSVPTTSVPTPSTVPTQAPPAIVPTRAPSPAVPTQPAVPAPVPPSAGKGRP
jgi:hypothetical protein